jgi:predicted Zn finger-like uncharacterized protein
MEIVCKNCNTSHYLSDERIPLETKTGKCKQCSAPITVLGKNALGSIELSLTQSTPPEPEATKNCDFCGEKILAIAKKCRHCGSMLDGSHVINSQSTVEPDIKPPEEIAPPRTDDFVDNTLSYKVDSAIKKAVNTVMTSLTTFYSSSRTKNNTHNQQEIAETLKKFAWFELAKNHSFKGETISVAVFVGILLIIMKIGLDIIFASLVILLPVLFIVALFKLRVVSINIPLSIIRQIFIAFSIVFIMSFIASPLKDKIESIFLFGLIGFLSYRYTFKFYQNNFETVFKSYLMSILISVQIVILSYNLFECIFNKYLDSSCQYVGASIIYLTMFLSYIFSFKHYKNISSGVFKPRLIAAFFSFLTVLIGSVLFVLLFPNELPSEKQEISIAQANSTNPTPNEVKQPVEAQSQPNEVQPVNAEEQQMEEQMEELEELASEKDFSKFPNFRKFYVFYIQGERPLELSEIINRMKSDNNYKEVFKKSFFSKENHFACLTDSEQLFIINKGKDVKVSVGKNNKRCGINAGEWNDFYTDKPLTDISDITVDRLVSFDDAWDSGASKWHKSKLIEFANYTTNFVVASKKSANDRDGDTIEDWLPDDEYIACKFIGLYVDLKRTHGLSFLDDEVDVVKSWKGDNIKSKSGYSSECNFYGEAYHKGLISDSMYDLPIR